MRVLFDHQAFTYQNRGGVSRYFTELWRNLPAAGADAEIAAAFTENVHVIEAGYPRSPFLGGFSFRGKSFLMERVNRLFTLRRMSRGDYDIFHPTYYRPYFLSQVRKPFVVTVYDMIHELFPENFPNDPTTVWKRELVTRAAKVIAISENTKSDLVRLMGVKPDKVEVIHLASSISPAPPPEGAGKYILFVGERGLYKNFPFFIRSLAPLLKGDEALSIRCTGGGPFSPQELLLLRNEGIEGRVTQANVDERSLAGLYSGAALFVYPSLYEGFGIPVLEAFRCGCPVVATGVSSLPEVGGDAAIYFEPNDAEGLRSAAARILYEPETRASLSRLGSERSALFSWEKTAAATADVYRSLL